MKAESEQTYKVEVEQTQMTTSEKNGSEPGAAPNKRKPEMPLSKTKIRLRLMIAIPVMTTLLVLGLGLIIIDMTTRDLLDKTPPSTVAEFRDRVEGVMGDTTVVIVISGGIALIAGLILAMTITYPIRRLTLGTASIASGDLTRMITLTGSGEIAMLGSAFNNMISTINQYLLQTLSGGVLTINEKAEITSMSSDVEVILGVSAQEFIGKPITKMIPDSPENKKFHQTIRSTLESHETYVAKEMLITTENRNSIPISISTSFLKDHDNTLVGLIISFEDVARLRRIQEQMRTVDRLTTLGGLAAGIAHQVRNPLCSIRGLAQLLKENAGDNLILNDYSEVILSDVDRINNVIERLLKFIQPTVKGWVNTSIDKIIKDTVLLAKYETLKKKEIDLRMNIQAGLPELVCQEENLIQALLNLIVNAFQAISGKGYVEISAVLEEEPNSNGAEEIRIQVTDNGPGIKRDDMNRIFNPSFTTKETGAGFGLVITRQTVEAHGGRITVESVPGARTTFTIWLPVRGKDESLEDEIERVEAT